MRAVAEKHLVEREQPLAVVETRFDHRAHLTARGLRSAAADKRVTVASSGESGTSTPSWRSGSELTPITSWPLEVLGHVRHQPVLPHHHHHVVRLEQEAVDILATDPRVCRHLWGTDRTSPERAQPRSARAAP